MQTPVLVRRVIFRDDEGRVQGVQTLNSLGEGQGLGWVCVLLHMLAHTLPQLSLGPPAALCVRTVYYV